MCSDEMNFIQFWINYLRFWRKCLVSMDTNVTLRCSKETIRKVRSSSWHTWYHHSTTFKTLENFISSFYGKQICWPTEKTKVNKQNTLSEKIGPHLPCKLLSNKTNKFFFWNMATTSQLAYKPVTLLKMTFVKEYHSENLKM